MKPFIFSLALLFPIISQAAPNNAPISVHTESYARPPYSGATYFVYTQKNKVICTKLEVCNKYDDCSSVYQKGLYVDELDENDAPFSSTSPVIIQKKSLTKHICLTRFKLI